MVEASQNKGEDLNRLVDDDRVSRTLLRAIASKELAGLTFDSAYHMRTRLAGITIKKLNGRCHLQTNNGSHLLS